MELVRIDAHTRVPALKQELRWNDLYCRLAGGA